MEVKINDNVYTTISKFTLSKKFMSSDEIQFTIPITNETYPDINVMDYVEVIYDSFETYNVFKGFITSINMNKTSVTIIANDFLSLLSNQTIDSSLIQSTDVITIIKSIFSQSKYYNYDGVLSIPTLRIKSESIINNPVNKLLFDNNETLLSALNDSLNILNNNGYLYTVLTDDYFQILVKDNPLVCDPILTYNNFRISTDLLDFFTHVTVVSNNEKATYGKTRNIYREKIISSKKSDITYSEAFALAKKYYNTYYNDKTPQVLTLNLTLNNYTNFIINGEYNIMLNEISNYNMILTEITYNYMSGVMDASLKFNRKPIKISTLLS